MSKVVVAYHLDPVAKRELLDLLEASGRVTLVPAPTDRLEIPPEAQVLFTSIVRAWSATRDGPPANWPPPNLRWAQILSAGVDFFPDWLLDSLPVVTARGTTAPGIAEYALTAMLTHAKRWDEVAVHSPSDWRQTTLSGLSEATVGIAGLGPIGMITARLSAAFGARVLGWRRSPEPVDGVELVASMDDLVRQSDHLVLALPHTAATDNIIDERILGLAKPGLHIVNVARGKLIDEEALLRALGRGQVAAATLDVTRREPPPEHHPFYGHPKIRMTPHVSWSSPGVDRRLAAKFLENVERFQAGLPLLDVADRAKGY